MFYHKLSEHINDSCTMYDFRIDLWCVRENRHVKDRKKCLIFSLVNLVTHFFIVMVVLLDFHGERMYQGHHPKPYDRGRDMKTN